MAPKIVNHILSLPEGRSLGRDAAEHVRQAILFGHLEPGQPLREEVLANTMNVSRGPIREAFRILEREGLVVIRRNRGAFVAQLSAVDLDEILSLRMMLEDLAIRQLIQRDNPQHLDELQRIVNVTAEYTERGITEEEAAELDMQFHDTIFRCCEHQRLLKCWLTVRHQIHMVLLSRNIAQPNFCSMIVANHQAMIDLLRAKDEARALNLSAEQIGNFALLAANFISDGRGDADSSPM